MTLSFEPNQPKNTHKSDSNSYSSKETLAFSDQISPDQISPEMISPQLEEEPENFNPADLEQPTRPRRQGLSLRVKATIAAIALGTLPVVGIGATAYYFANKSITKQVSESKQTTAVSLASQVNVLMRERYTDAQRLSILPILKNPKVRAVTTLEEKQQTLDYFLQASKAYDSIAVADLEGNTIVQSSGEPVTGLGERDYFKGVLQTKRPVITEPRKSKLNGKFYVFIAAPIFDAVTGKIIAVVRTRTPAIYFTELLKNFATAGDEYQVIAPSGKIIISNKNEQLERNAEADISGLAQLRAANKPGTLIGVQKLGSNQELLAYTPFESIAGMPDLNWGAVISTDEQVAFASQRQLLLTLAIGTGITALLVGAIAAYLANRATRPILAAADAVEKLGQGELDTRLTIQGEDEIATLGSNINQMAGQLQNLLHEQEIENERTKLLAEVAGSSISGYQDLNGVFNKALQGARESLNAARVVIYRFNPDWSGYIVAESVGSGWTTALNDKIADPCIGQQLIEAYRNGRIVATDNVFAAGFHPDHLKLMERLQIKANLVTPIVQNEQLYGLLIAHHCEAPYEWQQSEINFLQAMSTRLGAILDRVNFLEQKEAEAERSKLLKDISVNIGQSLNSEEIFNKAVQEVRQGLKSDRVVVYSFNEKWQGTVIAESVTEGWPRALGAKIDDPCFAQRYVEKYRQGRVQATEDIYKAGLTACHIKQLEPFAVKANLVAPILQGGQLLGLLIAHQCSAPRQWQQGEIDLFSQLATQIGFALDRANLLNQQKAAKEFLQRRALELLIEVDPVSRGDLTIRANVTEDEIGTVADSYNATINSLRKIVAQVQTAAKQMAATTSNNEGAVQGLSAEALRQAEEINGVLDRIQEMSNSIRAVAKSAGQAKMAVQQAAQTVEAGDAAMNRTVEGILAIRETVAQTTKKVKRLGESSQKISKVVNLISTFADQTNLLALNASIEAAHAGEQGRGFAVVADEVRTLARQSAAATAEIENLVKEIQTETNEVVAAMEAGTQQVVTGTRLVDETRQSLNQITEVSSQISGLVQQIVSAAVTQAQASKEVIDTMAGVAAIASQTSNEATAVSASFKELLTLAQELQSSAAQFKVS